MAWPGENEHKEYLDYVTQQQENGQEALSKEQWRQQKNPPPNPEAVKSVTDALMRK